MGNIIDTEIVENLGAGKEVAIKKSFFKTTTDEGGQETTHYYRVIQRLTGSTVMLTPEQATKQIRVMEVKNTEAGAYQVTITMWTITAIRCDRQRRCEGQGLPVHPCRTPSR